jgi:hypothetical protein
VVSPEAPGIGESSLKVQETSQTGIAKKGIGYRPLLSQDPKGKIHAGRNRERGRLGSKFRERKFLLAGSAGNPSFFLQCIEKGKDLAIRAGELIEDQVNPWFYLKDHKKLFIKIVRDRRGVCLSLK